MTLSVQARPVSIPLTQQDRQEEPPNNHSNGQDAGVLLIQQLKDRTRKLELGLRDEKLRHGQSKAMHEQELFAERQQCAKLEEELAQAREREKVLTETVQEKETQLIQKEQIIRTNREEIEALNRLVLHSHTRVNALEEQMKELRSGMIQMARHTNELQRQHLNDQRELQMARQRRHQVEPVTLIDKFFVFIHDTISGKTPKEKTYV